METQLQTIIVEVVCHYLPTSPRQPPTRLNMQHAISRPGATSRVSIPGPVSREQRGPVFTRVRVTVYKHPTRGRGTVKDTDSAKLFLFFLTICFSRYLQLYIGLVAKVWEPSMLLAWFCCVNCWRGRGSRALCHLAGTKTTVAWQAGAEL